MEIYTTRGQPREFCWEARANECTLNKTNRKKKIGAKRSLSRLGLSTECSVQRNVMKLSNYIDLLAFIPGTSDLHDNMRFLLIYCSDRDSSTSERVFNEKSHLLTID